MCATSIGLTFSHSPVPGVRKSGIPDGTEIPAPVRTTAPLGAELRSSPRATARAHFPLNLACRLPRNAPIPSFASSEPNTSPKRLASACEPLVEVAVRSTPS